ncbi:MAG: hypothetical protein H7A45_04240 [Verrucomicrobiales bacterium]|nr:hypothetical protein [Verrucomicrobiales bacterium]
MKSSLHDTLKLAAALVTVAWPASTRGQVFDLGVSASSPGFTALNQQLYQAGTTTVAGDFPNISGGTAHGYATATGAPGVLKARVSGSATAPWPSSWPAGSSGSVQLGAHVTYEDTLTISAPGVPAGTVGSAVAALWVPGSLTGGTASHDGYSSYATADAQAVLNGHFLNGNYSFGDGIGAYSGQPGIPTQITVPFTFTFDTPFAITIHLSLFGQATAYNYHSTLNDPPAGANSAWLDVDYGSSVYWDGLSGVTAGGSLLAPDGFSASGASGTDYTLSYVPVPEPELWAIGSAVGLLALVIGRCRDAGMRGATSRSRCRLFSCHEPSARPAGVALGASGRRQPLGGSRKSAEKPTPKPE